MDWACRENEKRAFGEDGPDLIDVRSKDQGEDHEYMDGKCEDSVRCKMNVGRARKSDCAW